MIEYDLGHIVPKNETGSTKCFDKFGIKYKEKCEQYHEKHCWTTHHEKCETLEFKNCKAMQASKQERKCHPVTELICSLKHTVEQREAPDVVTAQKCHDVTG